MISNAAKYAVVINVESCLRTVQVRLLFLLMPSQSLIDFSKDAFMAWEICDFAVLTAVKGNIENHYLKRFKNKFTPLHLNL